MGIHVALTSLLSDLAPDLTLLEAKSEMRRVAEELARDCPVGYVVKGYAGQGGRTTTPWVGIFDSQASDRPSPNPSPSRGLYVAYIRHPDSRAVTLTLQQGSDDLRERVGAPAARNLLRQKADWIRDALGLEADPLVPGSFGPGKRQPQYEAGSVGSITYRDDAIPPDDVLREHLQSMLTVLDEAVSALRKALGPNWADVDVPSVQNLMDVPPLPVFTPKSSESYRVEIAASSQIKTRLHENVVNDLAARQAARGWKVASEHPIDLVLRRSGDGEEKTYIVEVKQVRGHNVVEAVREAVGQLLWYRFFEFSEEQRPCLELVAAFSEDVGFAARQLLNDLNIVVLWLDDRQWHGCARAVADDLVPRL